MEYTEVKSEFIKEEIKKTEWSNRNYISDLMFIERLASGENFGNMHDYFVMRLSTEHPDEWSLIFNEANSDWRKSFLKKKKKTDQFEHREFERIKKQKETDKKRSKQLWLNMGGMN